MPLPQALAAKLAKRGIIKLPTQPKEAVSENEVVSNAQEEIIAEDYDETPQVADTPIPPPLETFDIFQGWHSCPNKWNVYHECTPACQERWKETDEIDKEYNRKRLKMLLRFPVPEHWEEILDAGIKRYYYWNTETDLVSWLPPGHPKCRVSLSAAQLRKQMVEEREERLKEETKDGRKMGPEEEEEESSEDEEDRKKRKKERTFSPKEDADSGDSSSESDDEAVKPLKEKRERDKREREKRERTKDRVKDRRERGKRRKEDKDALDPMDPAAYSECPRGTWASGLPERNEARTGVDTTATGPLFQMRPYPNPGAVLRANSAANSVGPKKPS